MEEVQRDPIQVLSAELYTFDSSTACLPIHIVLCAAQLFPWVERRIWNVFGSLVHRCIFPPLPTQSTQLPGYSATFVQPASLASPAAARLRTPALQ